MSNESGLWQLMKPHMLGHVVRIENYVGSGQPDVNGCCVGLEWWMELKDIDVMPKRPDTVVRINHFKPEQRNWLRLRAKAGGRVFLFARSLNDFFLFDGLAAAEHVGIDWVQGDWIRYSLGWWRSRVNWQEFNKLVLGR